MTLDQYIVVCKEAISANYKYRNIAVYWDRDRQERIQKQRRDKIREWIDELKLCLHPSTAAYMADSVKWKIN